MNLNKHCYHSTHWSYHEVMSQHLVSNAALSMNTSTRIANVDTVLQFLACALCKQWFVLTELSSIPLHILCRYAHAHKIQTYTCLEMHIIHTVSLHMILSAVSKLPHSQLVNFSKAKLSLMKSLWSSHFWHVHVYRASSGEASASISHEGKYW